MTPAELKCAREGLGLSTGWLADRWGVAVMTVKRWERDRAVPAEAAADMDRMVREFERSVADGVARADGYIEVPRTDADSLGPYPASYYRAVAREVARRTGGTIAYRGGS